MSGSNSKMHVPTVCGFMGFNQALEAALAEVCGVTFAWAGSACDEMALAGLLLVLRHSAVHKLCDRTLSCVLPFDWVSNEGTTASDKCVLRVLCASFSCRARYCWCLQLSPVGGVSIIWQ
jgi:hypothetical protein